MCMTNLHATRRERDPADCEIRCKTGFPAAFRASSNKARRVSVSKVTIRTRAISLMANRVITATSQCQDSNPMIRQIFKGSRRTASKACLGNRAMASKACQANRATANKACQGSRVTASKAMDSKVMVSRTSTSKACLGSRATDNRVTRVTTRISRGMGRVCQDSRGSTKISKLLVRASKACLGNKALVRTSKARREYSVSKVAHHQL